MNAGLTTNRKPLAIDLFCGLGGWTEGLLAEGYEVIGYDIEAHEYGDEKYPGKLVLQDVMTIDGAAFKDADLIVASPPCQEFSYMAMPWGRAKQIARALRGEDVFPEPYHGSRNIAELRALFDACFRIQREASAAAGRRIPMVVENVKGAQAWLGAATWNYGSFYLWGDIPALMPNRLNAIKNDGGGWFAIGSPGQKVTGANPVRAYIEGVKNRDLDGYERDHPQAFGWKKPATSSHSKARKAASAKIAKIPFALSSHIARVYKPDRQAVAA